MLEKNITISDLNKLMQNIATDLAWKAAEKIKDGEIDKGTLIFYHVGYMLKKETKRGRPAKKITFVFADPHTPYKNQPHLESSFAMVDDYLYVRKNINSEKHLMLDTSEDESLKKSAEKVTDEITYYTEYDGEIEDPSYPIYMLDRNNALTNILNDTSKAILNTLHIDKTKYNPIDTKRFVDKRKNKLAKKENKENEPMLKPVKPDKEAKKATKPLPVALKELDIFFDTYKTSNNYTVTYYFVSATTQVTVEYQKDSQKPPVIKLETDNINNPAIEKQIKQILSVVDQYKEQ